MRQWRRLELLLEKVAEVKSVEMELRTSMKIANMTNVLGIFCIYAFTLFLTAPALILTLISPETSTRTANVVRCVEEQEILSVRPLCCTPVVTLASDHPPRSRLNGEGNTVEKSNKQIPRISNS